MKTIFTFAFIFSVFTFSQAEARDLVYKFGAGYRQVTLGAAVPDGGTNGGPVQVHSLDFSYGIAPDLQLGMTLGFTGDFGVVAVGPGIRYEIERLISRDSTVWNNLNIYLEAKFLAKLGGDIEAGITMHAPYFGFEILPFNSNNFAIGTGAGLVVDFVKDSEIGFTQGMFGDVGVKYYF